MKFSRVLLGFSLASLGLLSGSAWPQIGTEFSTGLTTGAGTFGPPAARNPDLRFVESTFDNGKRIGRPTTGDPTAPPALVSAVSRKVHGNAGTFDLPLSMTTTTTTEPRRGPAQTIVFTFDKAISGAVTTISEGAAGPTAPTFNGHDVTVDLTGVADQQYVTITLTNVTSSDGGVGGTGSVRVGFLLGDVNQNRVVSLADLGLVNAQLAQVVTAANFLKDVNASGTLTLADKGITNANLTRALPAVTWAPGQVNYTIGSGQAASDPVLVTLQSADTLVNVSFTVDPQLQSFVSVDPGTIASVQANTPYDVRLHVSIPPGAAEGLYTGSLHLKSGNQTLPQTLQIAVRVDYGNNQVNPATRVLSPQTAQFLSSVSPDRTTLSFTQMTAELAGLEPGSILILGASPAAPSGFIGRVSNVTITGNDVVVTTTPAGLLEAFASLDVNLSRTLTQADLRTQNPGAAGSSLNKRQVDLPAPRAGQFDGFSVGFDDVAIYEDVDGHKVTLDGSINLKPSWDFTVRSQPSLNVHFVNTTTFVADMAVNAGLSGDVSKTFDLCNLFDCHLDFSPYIIWAGWIPFVVTPQLTITVGVNGTVSLGLTMSDTDAVTLGVGFDYANGTVTPIGDFSNSFTSQPPTPAASADAKAFAGPQLNFLIDLGPGPFATVRPYVELDISLFDHPQYQLLGGLEAAVGVHLGFLDTTIQDYEFPTLISYQKILEEGDFDSGPSYVYVSQFGTAGSGNGQFNFPLGVAIDPTSHNIVVADWHNNRVQIFNSAGIYQSQFGSLGSGSGQFNGPAGVAIDATTHNIVVADQSNNRVQIFDSAGVYLSQFGIVGSGNGQFQQLVSVAIDPTSHNIVVADQGNNRVQIFNSAGIYQSQFGTVGSGNGQFQQPVSVAIDSTSHNIVVADWFNFRVQVFSSVGVYQSQFGTKGTGNGQFNDVAAVAIDPANHNIIVSEEDNRVQVFNSAGVYQSQFGTAGSGNGQFNHNFGVAIDPSSHNIVVADQGNNRVQIFAPQ